jgi:CheY-like chemotaxis protein
VNAKDDPELARQVREALTCLYDHTYLQRHPLAERLVSPQAAAARTRAQELRRILLDAIEELNPGDNVPIRAVERRPYAILFGLYVEGRTWRQVADSLGVGGRQLRRDRAAAMAALCSILQDRYLAAPIDAIQTDQDPLRLEGERLAQRRALVDLGTVVQELMPLLENVASEHRVSLVAHIEPALPKLNTSRTLVRQVLINLASQALQKLPLAQLSLDVRPSGTVVAVGLGLSYVPEETRAEGGLLTTGAALELAPAETLLATLGGSLRRETIGQAEETIWVLLPCREETVVLVVDDNHTLFTLFQRYTAGQPYRLVYAASADQALGKLDSLKPDVITLDLMMPNRDGWELLGALRAHPGAAHVPVIVCSVLAERELALSQGAQLYLTKPVVQVDLLRALEQAKTMAWEGASRRAPPAHNAASVSA